jgi:hypothetical protein
MTETQELVYNFYKDDTGAPILLTGGQDEIFSAIAKKTHPRLHVMCHTRYGKSMTAGLAVLTRAATYPEKWAIVSGTKEKAQIIMAVVNSHIFDNDYIKSRYMPDKGESLEELRRYRNKNRVTFKIAPDQYSEVFVGSAQDAIGFGAQNVVEEEGSLVEDNDHSFVMRMLGDNPFENFLCKIGNPFQRNHFLKSFTDPAYHQIVWDCYKSLTEGMRINQATIDENRSYSFFKVLYECKFPGADEIDESGWMRLLTDEDIDKSQKRANQPSGTRRLGVDVARGGRNYNCWVLRTDTTAEVLAKNLDGDLTSVGDTTVNFMRDHALSATEVYVDDTGVGGGVTDYLKSIGVKINPVNFGESGEKQEDPVTSKQISEYLNLRAEVYAGKESASVWIKSGGQLKPHKDWMQLTEIRYKKDASGKTKIEPKEDMRKRGIESPDVADALALTFAKSKNYQYHGIDPAVILSGGVKPYYPKLNI